MEVVKVAVLATFIINFVCGQENAGTNVAPDLQQCYNNTRFVTREYRLPSSINVLIELIRRAEDGNPSQDTRELSFQILHRFRQDGIIRTRSEVDSSQGLPFSPKRWEAFKNRVQLTKLTPGNAINFNNDSLSILQACSLHFMISSTIETRNRGDESNVCSGIARYTSRVHKRQTETFESSSISSCPIESGVVYTKWGAVKAGLLLSGIASGLQKSSVPAEVGYVDNRYGSTLAGELSEVALLNEKSSPKTVGSKGGWNNTVEPKYYFLEQSTRENLFLTDAEIRGGLDGLYMALNVEDWKNKFGNIKISQILDLYYGRGVFNDTARACNRKKLLKDQIDSDTLVNQTALFNYLLDPVSQISYTPNKENFPLMATTATNSLRSYLNSNLNDLECSAEENEIERTATDVLIFIDMSWNYKIIQPFVSYILENLDVNKYESSYTVFDGANCNTVINKTRSILDYYENFNLTEQQKYPSGFDYSKVVQTAENIFRKKLDNQTDLTGQSTIILMLPHQAPTSSQSEYVRSKRSDFRSLLPDLRILVAGSDSKTSYTDLVTNANSDIFTISDNDNNDNQLKETAKNLIARFKKLPRSVVNPSCGSLFTSSGSQNFEVSYYVEPSGVNYHKIAPNYFYGGQTLKIRGENYGTLIACTSRTDANPRANTTGTECKTIISDEISLDISTYCTDENVIDCSPIYISIQGTVSNSRCLENTCRFPDSIKYTIALESVECSSSSETIITNLLLLVLLVAVIRF